MERMEFDQRMKDMEDNLVVAVQGLSGAIARFYALKQGMELALFGVANLIQPPTVFLGAINMQRDPAESSPPPQVNQFPSE